jgi:uncharacterized membrane-anchored protein
VNGSARQHGDSEMRHLMNKVPEVTLWFWIIKVLCTTVGETLADYLNETLGFGLTNTTLVMTAALVVTMVWQFKSRRYVPFVYWLNVVLVSVVGTLVTDNLTDRFDVSLKLSTAVFAVALSGIFYRWVKSEGTMSIHSIRTPRREAFYWLAILCTFALGTAAGDLVSEQFKLGYATAVAIFAAAITLVVFGRYALKLSAVPMFWVAYILTRPLGGSIGDYMSSDKSEGGLGLGTTLTSITFLAVILLVVGYLSISGADATE